MKLISLFLSLLCGNAMAGRELSLERFTVSPGFFQVPAKPYASFYVVPDLKAKGVVFSPGSTAWYDSGARSLMVFGEPDMVKNVDNLIKTYSEAENKRLKNTTQPGGSPKACQPGIK